MGNGVHNYGNVDKQVNIDKNEGSIILTNKTRFSKRFEKLNEEVLNDERYEGVMDSLKKYLTKLDGISMPEKLEDGGFTEKEILKATIRKDKYAKQLEKNKFYESSQWIDSQLFAKIMIEFETHAELPLINNGADKNQILHTVVEKVIKPILDLINIEGENDTFLNYTLEDVFGMVYYLTGKCHINWKNYNSI